MMRVAIAGTGGLALLVAHFVIETTSHQLILLSRMPKPDLVTRGYQVQVVDYDEPTSLQHALMGVDTVISTICGDPQLRLIEAAILCRVRRFAPSEFEGRPSLRTSSNIAYDRGKSAAMEMLQRHSSVIKSTAFVCGVFYERFAPGGMASYRIGLGSGISNEGDYILNIRQSTARVPATDINNNLVSIAMTGARDVAEFVVKALDLDEWPPELTMCGQRILVRSFPSLLESTLGRHLDATNVQWDNPGSLWSDLALAQYDGNFQRQMRAHNHLVTAEGQLDFVTFNLNAAFPEKEPEPFTEWLRRAWTM